MKNHMKYHMRYIRELVLTGVFLLICFGTTVYSAPSSEQIKSVLEAQPSCQNFVRFDDKNLYLGFGEYRIGIEEPRLPIAAKVRVAPLDGSAPFELTTGDAAIDLVTDSTPGLEDSGTGTVGTSTIVTTAIDAKYYFSGQESTSLYIKAGVLGSTLTSSNTAYATPTTEVGAKSWETAFLGGLGIKFNLSSATDLLIEADYSRSIDSVFNNSNVYRSDLSAALGLAVNL